MSRSVRISLKTARSLLDFFTVEGELSPEYRRECEELLKGIGEASKPKRSVKAAKARRTAKKATKREETAGIREKVRARAEGGCELCPDLGTELHHVLGRRVKQSEQNCLWLCRNCHHGITTNRPSAAYWLEAQARKIGGGWPTYEGLGFSDVANQLWARLEFVKSRSALSHREGAP